jgi:hypothetical protein
VCARYLAAAGATISADDAPVVAACASARSPAEAWVQGAFAAVEAIKRIVGAGTPAHSARLELP